VQASSSSFGADDKITVVHDQDAQPSEQANNINNNSSIAASSNSRNNSGGPFALTTVKKIKSKTCQLLVFAMFIVFQILMCVPVVILYYLLNGTAAIAYSFLVGVFQSLMYGIPALLLCIGIVRTRLRENFHILKSLTCSFVNLAVGTVLFLGSSINILLIFFVDESTGATLYWLYLIVDFTVHMSIMLEFTVYVVSSLF